MFKKIKVKNILGIIFGAMIISIGINLFLKNADLLSGGITGIALIINKITNLQVGIVVLLLNIPLFLLSFKYLNKNFTIYSLFGMITLSFGLVATESLIDILYLDDKLLLALYGGVLNGLGAAIIFLNHGSTGGSDIISMLIRKKKPMFNIGQISFGFNLLVVTIGSVLFGLTSGLYTLISMYTTSIILNNVIKGFNSCKSVFIITDKDREISDTILEQMQRGVTKISAEGAYTNKEKTILYCVISLSELPDLKELVLEKDKYAFITITDTSEIVGKGFKKSI